MYRFQSVDDVTASRAGYRMIVALATFIAFWCGTNSTAEAQIRVSIANEKAESTSAGIERYVMGTANGVVLKIPERYLLRPIVYQSGEPDEQNRVPETSSTARKIDNFGILFRLSNLKSIENTQDERDWLAAMSKPLFKKTWMMVSLDARHFSQAANADKPPMIPQWGPYIFDSRRPYGLMHWISTQSVDDGAKHFYGHVEYYYDSVNVTTIRCNTYRKNVPPFNTFDSCEHQFVIPALRLTVRAFYTKKDIYRWRDIEGVVINMIASFIQR